MPLELGRLGCLAPQYREVSRRPREGIHAALRLSGVDSLVSFRSHFANRSRKTGQIPAVKAPSPITTATTRIAIPTAESSIVGKGRQPHRSNPGTARLGTAWRPVAVQVVEPS
jgi:hypothetical protein